MKRRALLLLGALLMPTAAHAQPKKPRTPSKRQAPKPAAKADQAHAAKPAAAAPSPAPALKEAKTQLVAFDASPFPYRGFLPDTTKPFLDARDGKRRGHTTGRGDVYWEETAYSDRRSLLYLPQGFDPTRPVLIVLFLHGQGATLERDVAVRQAVPRQIAESGQNIALVAPQLALDALDSSAGNFWRGGHFAKYLDEAAERLMRLYGNRSARPRLQPRLRGDRGLQRRLPVGAYALQRGGANHRVKGLILLDALYGEEDKFAAWFAARRQQAFLLSAYTESTKDENAALQGLLAKRRIQFTRTLPKSLTPGTVAFLGPTAGSTCMAILLRARGRPTRCSRPFR